MPGLIGRKIGMTSVFSADGKNVPCTVIEAGPCVVTQVKTVEKDGYKAVQLGFGEAKEKNTTKPMLGVFKKAGTTPKRHLAEFKFDEEYNLGDTITVDIFSDATFVDVVGTSKGKGFQGVMKRHGFGGVGQSTHGQDDRARKPGSTRAPTVRTTEPVSRDLSAHVLIPPKFSRECAWPDRWEATELLPRISEF